MLFLDVKYIFGPYYAKKYFFRDSCGGFVLTLKMKPKFDYWTPRYFCDIDIFHKMPVSLANIKDKFEISFLSPLCELIHMHRLVSMFH